ncbi:MAG TPA: OsmC family protein [Candidatus Eisenbacteria bacterium]|nr:OsmC family protein [Candidatus Eisenbacteria bacterium]
MGEYTAVVSWTRDGAVFTDNRYGRGHTWAFDGGIAVPASASPLTVPIPLSVAAAVDPEEAFVAALSSCHMLWFLSLAAKRGFTVESYRDHAVGLMTQGGDGRLAMTQVTLRPVIALSGDRRPAPAELDALHHEAHELCYIANSVKTDVRCEPVYPGA